MLNKQVMPMMAHVDLRIPLRAPNPLMTSQFAVLVFTAKKKAFFKKGPAAIQIGNNIFLARERP